MCVCVCVCVCAVSYTHLDVYKRQRVKVMWVFTWHVTVLLFFLWVSWISLLFCKNIFTLQECLQMRYHIKLKEILWVTSMLEKKSVLTEFEFRPRNPVYSASLKLFWKHYSNCKKHLFWKLLYENFECSGSGNCISDLRLSLIHI